MKARLRIRDEEIECVDERGESIICCTGADTIVSIEPLAYSLQRQGIEVNQHCDYVIVRALHAGADREPCILLVEIDPLLRHGIEELYEKMKVCRRITNCIIEVLAPEAHGVRVVEVVIASHVASKTSEARTLAKQGFSIVNCWENILKACKR